MVTGRPGGLILLPGDTSNGLGLGVKVERPDRLEAKLLPLSLDKVWKMWEREVGQARCLA